MQDSSASRRARKEWNDAIDEYFERRCAACGWIWRGTWEEPKEALRASSGGIIQMTEFAIDLSSLASEAGLLPESDILWRDADVPLYERGVTLRWLIHFVQLVERQLAEIRGSYESQRRRSSVSTDVPWPSEIPFDFRQTVTPAFLVHRIIKPLTDTIKGPLFARVPTEHRGRPDLFVSHVWGNPLVGSTGSFFPERAFSTLWALESPLKVVPVQYVWIDMACYNQHHVESIAANMKTVIGSIGRLGLPMINSAPFNRLWCLWELLCAFTEKAEVVIFEANDAASDLGLLWKEFDSEFKSVEQAETTLPEDREQILSAMRSTFGSIRESDRYVRAVLKESLSKKLGKLDMPWNRERQARSKAETGGERTDIAGRNRGIREILRRLKAGEPLVRRKGQ